MKRLQQIHGLWLVLQIISTSQQNATVRNVTSKLILLPTPSILKPLDKQTVIVHILSTSVMVKRYTNTPNSQSSEISKSGTLLSVFTAERTRTQSVRNLYNNTQSQSARDILKNTQTWSVGLKNISSTENSLIVWPNRTYMGTKTYALNPSTVGLQTSTRKVTSSSIIVHTTGVPHGFSSEARARISSTVHRATNSAQSVLQSRITESKSSYGAPVKSRVESSSRNYHRLASSSNYRFLSSLSTTQTRQPSRIIDVSFSRLINVSVTEKLKTEVSVTSSYPNKYQSSYTANKQQSSTSRDFETSKILDTVYIMSSYRGSQFSRHGSDSYLTNMVYLSSTTTANQDSSLKPTRVPTPVQNISQTSANKESINTQRQSSSQKTILENLRSSFSKDISSVDGEVTELSSLIVATKGSSFHSRMKSSSKVTDYKSTEEKSTELLILSSITTTTTRHNRSSGEGPDMPLYVLAICLPLAGLLGFTLAFVCFKCNKEDHRVRYSVTVEISSEKPDYELKRMYSIIDVTAGINKDLLSGLESRKASSEILDQLDTVSVSINAPSDQNV